MSQPRHIHFPDESPAVPEYVASNGVDGEGHPVVALYFNPAVTSIPADPGTFALDGVPATDMSQAYSELDERYIGLFSNPAWPADSQFLPFTYGPLAGWTDLYPPVDTVAVSVSDDHTVALAAEPALPHVGVAFDSIAFTIDGVPATSIVADGLTWIANNPAWPHSPVGHAWSITAGPACLVYPLSGIVS